MRCMHMNKVRILQVVISQIGVVISQIGVVHAPPKSNWSLNTDDISSLT